MLVRKKINLKKNSQKFHMTAYFGIISMQGKILKKLGNKAKILHYYLIVAKTTNIAY